MSDEIPTIEPMGIRPQFKRIKPYLKSYVRGFDDEQYQDKIANLQRYAREGEGFQYEVAYSRPLKFDFCTAYFELVGAYWTEQWFAVQGALGETDENWQLRRQRSVAYGY
jgi:hypothetical protein